MTGPGPRLRLDDGRRGGIGGRSRRGLVAPWLCLEGNEEVFMKRALYIVLWNWN